MIGESGSCSRMRAAVLYKPMDIRVESVDGPSVDRGHALVSVESAGICRTDLEIYRGAGTPADFGLSGGFPAILGHEFSGEVVELGEGVRNVDIGDRVTCECIIGCGECPACKRGRYNLCETPLGFSNGAFAECISVPSKGLHAIPENASFDDAALTEPTAVALHAARRVDVRTGSAVAVLGAGTLGFLCVQVSKALGASFVALTGTRDERLEVGAKIGADVVVNVEREDPSSEIREATKGKGVDAVIITAAGSAEVLGQAVEVAKRGAEIAIIGLSGRKKSQVDPDQMVFKDLEIKGIFASPNTWEGALHMISSGRVRTEPIISHRLPLERAKTAFEILDRREGIKVLLKP